MRRLLSPILRAGLALSSFLLVLALLRFSPVFAEPPLPVRGLPLAVSTLLLGMGSALSAGERRAGRWGRALSAAVISGSALAVLVIARGPVGLSAAVETPAGLHATLPPAPVDLTGDDLDAWPHSRKWTVSWVGPLRVPASGSYVLRATGRGRAVVRIDERTVLLAEGERLDGAASVLLGGGAHRLEVRYDRTGPGSRLRLLWTRPRSNGERGSYEDVIAPRYLGAAWRPGLWRLTDLLALCVAGAVAWLLVAVPWDARRRLPAPRPLAAAEIAGWFGAHVALVAALSWPLITDPVHLGPVDRPDGRLNAWILAWDAHALLHEPGRLFEAPIFHPLPDALAFSENLLLPALMTLPALALGGPLLGYNLFFLLSAALSGLGAQLLVARVTRDHLAGFVGGALFGVGVHRFVNMAHLHAQATLFLPLALLAFDRFLEWPTLARALVVGLLVALQGASSVYLGAITATLVSVAAALAWLSGLRLKELLHLAAGLLVAAALLAPLVQPYLRMRDFEGEEFRLETLASYATTPESYLASAGPYESLSRRHLDPDRVHDPLFPGVVPVLLGVAGLAVAPRRYAALAVLGSATAFVISLGPATPAFRFLHENVVLFHGIRAVGRFALVPVLALAVLSGLALAGRRRLALAAFVLFLLESDFAPIHYGRYAPPPALARRLAGRPGAVAFLPLGEDDTRVMLEGIAHFRPLVNGDSGFMPRPYTRAMELLNGPLSEGALRLLRAIGVRDVVAREDLPLAPVERLGAQGIYEVPPGDSARPVAGAPEQSVLWSGEGALIDLGAPLRVGRITFEVSEAPWLSRPRVAVSSDGREFRDVAASADLADAVLSLYRDPRRGLGELRFAPLEARYIRLDRRLPARAGSLGVGP